MDQDQAVQEYYRSLDTFVVFCITPDNRKIEIDRFQDENLALKLVNQQNSIEVLIDPKYRREYDYFNLNVL